MFISASSVLDKKTFKKFSSTAKSLSPEFKWRQVAPPGSGTHQYEWKHGTYPSAIVPVVGANSDLWMIGQKKAWSSKDGITWQAYDKIDWAKEFQWPMFSLTTNFGF
jgi:hypothetical protein